MFSKLRLKPQTPTIRTGLTLTNKKLGGQHKKIGIFNAIFKLFPCLVLVILCCQYHYIFELVNNSPSYTHVPTSTQEIQDNGKSDVKTSRIKQVEDIIVNIKNEFFERYGGKEEALSLLSKGIISPGSNQKNKRGGDIEHLATRILLATASWNKKFSMAFGGYSVTVGRGNYFNQSYPFIVQDILLPVFKQLGVDLEVRNAAIGGIPSFPYGWCLQNFLGSNDIDVISWDFSMNEKDLIAFEAYMRHSMMLNQPYRYNALNDGENHRHEDNFNSLSPMLIVLDQKPSRIDLLKKYIETGYLADPIAVSKGEIANSKYLKMMDSDEGKPKGYKHWDEWGAPKGSPGQQSWHPKYMEHEMIGWIIAMHFISALEYSLDIMRKHENWTDIYNYTSFQTNEKRIMLPKPYHESHAISTTSLFLGTPIDEKQWTINPFSCRTYFKPTVKGSMADIIVSGISKYVNDTESVMEERSDKDYKNGWLVDVGDLEKKTKRKVMKYGGLGYIDMKIALYGSSSSGTLSLFLPYEYFDNEKKNIQKRAVNYIPKIVFCEVNEKRGDKECNIEKDLDISVGGIQADKKGITEVKYLNKQICILVEVPIDARLSYKSKNSKITSQHDTVGLEVEVSVNNADVNHRNGACSIANIIWENINNES